MHSMLIQVKQDEPFEEDELNNESDYYDSFVGGIADYVDKKENSERKEYIERLKYRLEGAAKVNVKKGIITIIDKAKYFEGAFKNFKKLLVDLNEMTVEDFASNMDTMHDLDRTVNNRFETYIDDGYYDTLDNFMRCANNGDKFYIGSVFDYHW